MVFTQTMLISSAGMQATVCWVCRSKFGLLADKCLALCDWLEGMGPGTDVEVQDAMARLTLDVVLMAGFGIASNTIGDPEPVPLLTELHYAMDESFRHVCLPCPSAPIARHSDAAGRRLCSGDTWKLPPYTLYP